MPTFSKTSEQKLATCHQDLMVIFSNVIKITDCSVICGHRGKKEQNAAFDKGFSMLKYPQSKHNKTPSMAVDVVPYPIDWSDEKRFRELAGIVKGVAFMLKSYGAIEHDIICGADWTNFRDYPHYQI